MTEILALVAFGASLLLSAVFKKPVICADVSASVEKEAKQDEKISDVAQKFQEGLSPEGE